MTRCCARCWSVRGLLQVVPLAIALGGTVDIACAAQVFPDRPVRMIVPYPPGGITDVLARTIVQRTWSAIRLGNSRRI